MTENLTKKQNFTIVYLGSPDFAVKPLLALLDAGYNVPLVITQPDRPKGRKRQLTPTAVKQVAEEKGIKVLATPNANKPEIIEEIKAVQPDLLVVAAFGQLMGEELVHTAPMGAINIHGSILPKYRGASPIQQAIIDGETETGITIMYIAPRLDAGDMLAKATCEIKPQDNTGTLRERLSEIGSNLLLKTITRMRAGDIIPEVQDEAAATYAGKITIATEQIDWQKPAAELHNLVRGLTPDTSAYTCYVEPAKDEQQRLKIWQTEVADTEAGNAAPGEVIKADSNSLMVATGQGVLKLITVQPAGKNQMNAAAWWRGRRDLQAAKLIFE
ncbi:MAG: methionyl-tRNA formyltransferase [Firmicutes bacterium]|nr:methionyl-tRNA formyltransferase [Bacillota bacterium]